MATTTKARTSRSTARKPKAEAPTPEPTTTEEPTAPKSTTSTYREVADFTPALKAAKSLSKGNVDLGQALQLITHLAWKTPSGSVGWAKGTTANVVAYADDIAVPVGTPIPVAMEAALSAASKAASDQPQKDAVGILSTVITSHN